MNRIVSERIQIAVILSAFLGEIGGEGFHIAIDFD